MVRPGGFELPNFWFADFTWRLVSHGPDSQILTPGQENVLGAPMEIPTYFALATNKNVHRMREGRTEARPDGVQVHVKWNLEVEFTSGGTFPVWVLPRTPG